MIKCISFHIILADASSLASTIMYAFCLNEMFSSDRLCTVPVVNLRRADLNTQAELKWLISSCQVDETALIFLDEVCGVILLTRKFPCERVIILPSLIGR